MKQATDKQEALISKLRGERIETDEVRAIDTYVLETESGRMSVGQASKLIEALLAAPRITTGHIEVGCQVRTPKFGIGTVAAIDGPVVTVTVARGEKKMHASALKVVA